MAALDLTAPPNVERLSMVHKELVEMSVLLKAKAEDLAKREVALHLREQSFNEQIDEYARETASSTVNELQRSFESQLRRLEAARSRFQGVTEAARQAQMQKDERIRVLEAENQLLSSKAASQRQRISALQKKLRVVKWQSSDTRQKALRRTADVLRKLEGGSRSPKRSDGTALSNLRAKKSKEVIELLYALLETLGATANPSGQRALVQRSLVGEILAARACSVAGVLTASLLPPARR
eukprot:scaffold30_cov255-Pinguiococcus_pyrenoidosus.AAC.16